MAARRATRPTSLVATVVIALLTVGLWWLQQHGDDDGTRATPSPAGATSATSHRSTGTGTYAGTPSRTAPATPASSPTSASPTSDHHGLPVVDLADLPPEASAVVDLIDAGGPYPYDQDDGTFGNYEQILPSQPRGYYREYTVETPGSYDRGARRIIAGDDGTLYWTADHYASFAVIER